MNTFFHNLKGDKVVWGVVIIMMIASIIVVYSAVSNLAWRYSSGGSIFYLIMKHSMHLVLGFGFMFIAYNIKYKYFSIGSSILLLPSIILLFFTLFQGNEISGANASRWIQIPFIGFGIQTSTVSAIILYTYVARFLSRNQDNILSFKDTLLPLWTPVILVIALILPANFSTAALVTVNVGIIMMVGRLPIKHLLMMVTMGTLLLTIFITIAIKFPDAFPNRVNTWSSRIESYTLGDKEKEQYQVESAKIAIAMGGLTGRGPGKSVQKNHLPQSSSDFIYAIVIEEFGLFGAFGLIVLYLTLLVRVVIISGKAPTVFGSLLSLSLGIPIVFQALVNMSVAVGLFPVTGQPLPLISSGGTSIWMICFSIGMILSVSRETQESEEKQQEEISEVELKEQYI